MRRHRKAQAGLLAFVVPLAFSAPAPAADTLIAHASSDGAFVLPINGYLDGTESKHAQDATTMKVLPPADEPSAIATQTPDAVPPEKTVSEVAQGGPIIIDNDMQGEQCIVDEFQWQEIPDEQGRTHIQTGAQFPVAVTSELSSKTAKVGDPIEARLKVDIKIGGRLIAQKGDKVVGHVSSAHRARRMIAAEFTPNGRWMRANGSVGIQFDEIITSSGEHLPLLAKAARKSRIVKNKSEGRVLGVNHNGEVATPLSIQLKHQALHLAIRGAASAGGVFSFGIVPLAYGVVGAMNPSFAFLHPVGQNVPHRRLKGFGMGVVSGLPGGFLIADTIIRGAEAVIKPGDEFLAEFKQDFTGEAATDAQLLPGARTKVRGEVLPKDGAGNKK